MEIKPRGLGMVWVREKSAPASLLHTILCICCCTQVLQKFKIIWLKTFKNSKSDMDANRCWSAIPKHRWLLDFGPKLLIYFSVTTALIVAPAARLILMHMFRYVIVLFIVQVCSLLSTLEHRGLSEFCHFLCLISISAGQWVCQSPYLIFSLMSNTPDTVTFASHLHTL